NFFLVYGWFGHACDDDEESVVSTLKWSPCLCASELFILYIYPKLERLIFVLSFDWNDDMDLILLMVSCDSFD
ncbi:uncharacterized protein A4U43_C08F11090, partial [Asparagus officinalis]